MLDVRRADPRLFLDARGRALRARAEARRRGGVEAPQRSPLIAPHLLINGYQNASTGLAGLGFRRPETQGAIEVGGTADVRLLMHNEGASIADDGPYSPGQFSGGGSLSSVQQKWGSKSILFSGGAQLGVEDVGNVHPSRFDFGTSPDTILDMQIRPTSYPSSGNVGILICHERNGPNWWRFCILDDGRIEFLFTVSGGTAVQIQTTTAAPTGAWSWVFKFDHGGRSYIGIAANGAATGAIEDDAANTSDYSGLSSGGAAGSVRMGNSAVSGGDFTGYIDEVRYVNARYYNGTTGDPIKAPIAAYP